MQICWWNQWRKSSLLASDRSFIFRPERAVHEAVQHWVYGWRHVDWQTVKVINLSGKHWCSIVHVDLVDSHNRKPTTREPNKNSGQRFGHFHFLHVCGSLLVFCIRVAFFWKHRPPHRETDTAIQARHDNKGWYYKRQSHAKSEDEILFHGESAVRFSRVKHVAFSRVKHRG